MLDLFVKRYSARDIHNYINVQFLDLLNNLNQELKKAELPEKYKKELETLKSLNLTESVNYKQIEELQNKIEQVNSLYDKNIRLVKFMKALKAYFGDNCILVKHEDFNTLLDKYNLASGALGNYTGTIPLKNLKEVSDVKEKLEFLDKIKLFVAHEPNYSIEDNTLKSSIQKRDEYTDCWWYSDKPHPLHAFDKEYIIESVNNTDLYKRSDFFKYTLKIPESINIKNKDELKDVLYYIDRFENLVEVTEVYKYGQYYARFANNRSNLIKARERYGLDVRTKSKTFKLFIVAPAQEMNCKVKVSKFIRSEDPFICGYTDLGIVIFSSWGDEANDEIIQRYKELQTYL